MSLAHWLELIVCTTPVVVAVMLCVWDPHDFRNHPPEW